MAAASSSPSSFQKCYDVFLSFRGEDTRNNFTAHLYKELRTKGISTFIDDDKLKRGEIICPALFTAIENSRFSVIILSENYAFSKWCLEELVKILDCMKTRKQTVLPVFYKVDPSDVRKQSGNFGVALAKHEENLKENLEKMLIWKDALTQVANLSGYHVNDKHEPTLIEEIVTYILTILFSLSSDDANNIVGIASSIREMESLLDLKSLHVRMVGICGMGGIGKTTLAKAIYNHISSQFEASSFLENIGEDFEKHGFLGLQEKLLSELLEDRNLKVKGLTSIKARLQSKKVFIVIDNLENSEILEVLIGKNDWFGAGSRIIVTTRNKQLLVSHGMNEVYEVQSLSYDNAIRLFSYYAFKRAHPVEDYKYLCARVVYYCQGLPLALKVLGSFLFGKSEHEWESELNKLQRIPKVEIQNVLRVSYDGLDDAEKDIFLDIACFFKGEDKDYVMEILNCCGFYPCIGIRVLVEKSLITTCRNRLMMHDLIQKMGWEIIREVSIKEPGKRSRLWIHEDIYHVLTKNTGTEEVEGIFLDLSGLKEVNFTAQAFASMNRLRLLKVFYNSDPFTAAESTFEKKKDCKVNFSQDFRFHYDGLRYLYVHGYNLESLPNDFNAKNLVDLGMPYSHIKQVWKGIKVLEKLKFMDLSHSKYLIETPNFTGVTNLERLVLEGCTSLCKIDPSIGGLIKLNFLSLRNCEMLESLTSSICNLKSLETVILSGCSKLNEFPENFGKLQMLKKIYADGTAIRELPSSFSFLRNLEELSFRGCKGPSSASWFLPRRSSHSIGFVLAPLSGLCSLKDLDLSDCNISDGAKLCDILGSFSCMRRLNLSGNSFATLPWRTGQLSHLRWLMLENCRKLQVAPELQSSMTYMGAYNCTSLEIGSNQSLYSSLMTAKLKNYPQWKSQLEYNSKSLLTAYSTVVPGNKIPDWIRHQSPSHDIEVELPPNWFNTNFLGFAFCFVIGPNGLPSSFMLDLTSTGCSLFDSKSRLVSFLCGSIPLENTGRRIESDHVWLDIVQIPGYVNLHEVSRIKVLFLTLCKVKRCGVDLVYRNGGVTENNRTATIQYIPPPRNSTLTLEEIHEGGSSGSGCFTDGSESENCDCCTADEGEPSASGCSNDDSESENFTHQYTDDHDGEPTASGCSNDDSESKNTVHEYTVDEGEPTAGCSKNGTTQAIQPNLPVSNCWNAVFGFFITAMSKLGCGCFNEDPRIP